MAKKKFKRHCWTRGRMHCFGKKKEVFNGLHYFKRCHRCGAMRITLHVGCSVSCWGGPA